MLNLLLTDVTAGGTSRHIYSSLKQSKSACLHGRLRAAVCAHALKDPAHVVIDCATLDS